VTAIDAVATYDVQRSSTTVFLVNREVKRMEEVEIVIAGKFLPVSVKATTLSDPDVYAKNTLHQPERVAPHRNDSVTIERGTVRVQLPPVSWTVIEITH